MGRSRTQVARKLRALDPVADLQRRLRREGLPAGVPKVRRITRAWWKDHGFAEQITAAGTAEVGKRVGIILVEQRQAEAKRAGFVVLGELVGAHLHPHDLVAFGALFDRGHIAAPVFVEPFATRVLARLLARDDVRGVAIAKLVHWRDASTTWQRQAACLALGGIASRARAIPHLADAICMLCSTCVWSLDTLEQAAIGVVLRELSRAEPERVIEFFLHHARFMSRPCARAAIGRLPAARRAVLLAHHKRATTI